MELHNLYSTPYIFKMIKWEVSHVQVSDIDNSQTDRQTDRETDRQKYTENCDRKREEKRMLGRSRSTE